MEVKLADYREFTEDLTMLSRRHNIVLVSDLEGYICGLYVDNPIGCYEAVKHIGWEGYRKNISIIRWNNEGTLRPISILKRLKTACARWFSWKMQKKL